LAWAYPRWSDGGSSFQKIDAYDCEFSSFICYKVRVTGNVLISLISSAYVKASVLSASRYEYYGPLGYLKTIHQSTAYPSLFKHSKA